MIKSLTSLRGIFILFIFFHHCLNIYPGGGSMAVAFFFILGGFSMTSGYCDRVLKSDFSYKQYLTRRCIKFYPLHWLCLLAAVPLALLSFKWMDIPVFFLNAALLQTLIPIEKVYFSFNAVSWYLADTMFLAVLFPFLLKWIVKATPQRRWMIAVTLVVIYTLVAILIPNNMRHAILYISPVVRITDFVLGVFLALGYLKMKEQLRVQDFFAMNGTGILIVVFMLIGLLVLESCVLPSSMRMIAPVYWPLIAMLIMISSLLSTSGGGKFLENRLLQRLGECSFTIFLTHQLVLRYSDILFYKILHIDNKIIYIAFTLSLTIVVSLIVERYILNPVTKWLKKKYQPSMTARS